MYCPRLHGTMENIGLSSDFSAPDMAQFCDECHGIWMRANACKEYLGFDPETLYPLAVPASIDLECPHCQIAMKVADASPSVCLHLCERCAAVFLDRGQFAVLSFEKLEASRKGVVVSAKSPLDKLGMSCCDCGSEIGTPSDACAGSIGYCCKRCYSNPPLFAEHKLQNVQLLTFRGMEVKVDHWRNNKVCHISVTPDEPCLLNVEISSLSFVERMMRFGYRKLALGGHLRKQLDATEGIQAKTPWHVFLKQRGVTNCLSVLCELGAIDIVLKPHILLFELKGERFGTLTRQRFEATIRRLLVVYERFVKMTHRYYD